MKKILTYILVTLGIIFVLQFAVLAYLWIADPFQIKPYINYAKSYLKASSNINSSTTPAANDQNATPNTAIKLTDQQLKLLKEKNIDPATLTTKITPQFVICATEILGAQRILQIQQGASPTTEEISQVIPCLQ